jgi:hypothetical protein
MDLIKDNIPKPKKLSVNPMIWSNHDTGWNVCLVTMKDSMGIIDVKVKN